MAAEFSRRAFILGGAVLLEAACSTNSLSTPNSERAYPLHTYGDGTVIFDPELDETPDRGLAGVDFAYATGYSGDPTGRSIQMVPVFDPSALPQSLRVISEERRPHPAYLVDKEFPVDPQGNMLGSNGEPRDALYPVIGLGLQDQEVVYVGTSQNGSSSYNGMRAYLLEPTTADDGKTISGLRGWRLRNNRTFTTPPRITTRPS